MRQAILAGAWPAGTRLPSSRALADELGFSRNTVLHAYSQLVAEGYMTTRPGSGAFVSDTLPRPLSSAVHPRKTASGATSRRTARITRGSALSARGEQVLGDAGSIDSPSGAFALGAPDTSAFPHAIWAKLIGRRWRRPPPELLRYAHNGGLHSLKQALSDHLHLSRSVHCDVDQIVVTTSIQQSVGLISHMLADIGDTVWIEEPGYRAARNLFRASGLHPVPIPVDGEGLAPSESDFRKPPRLMYVTPSHQFPLGMVMSLARRRMLLEYAHRHNVWILEDDYDSEFRFEGRPIPSLQAMDEHGRVIYLGSLSKSLFPGIRTGYLVLPHEVAQGCAAGFAELYREGQLIQQAALADFLSEGHYAVHIRRMRRRYAQKQALLRACIAEEFGADWPISTHEAGLHLVLHLPERGRRSHDDVAIYAEAAAQGIVTRPLSLYYLDRKKSTQGLLLGYANVAPDQIRPAFEKLARIIAPT